MAGLDTPRTMMGDATYLSNPNLDFDISQEQSFQSPTKDGNNLLQQLQNGRRGMSLKTPRSRAALNDRRNLPAGLGGGEFTPLLKNATRNSALKNGKENIPATPAFGGLGNIPEDLTPLPAGSSIYGGSRNGTYLGGTPMPAMDSSSTASTPMAMLPRRNEGPGMLHDGNQLSLREQENVIDRIEKENFGLKLKCHFLEEALSKKEPGYSEAALKENTDLKVDKMTMLAELSRYRKSLGTAQKDLELYRQQFADLQERMKRKNVDVGQKEELERLRLALEDRDAEIAVLKSREHQFEDLEDKVHDLESDLREKDRLLDDRDDDIENLKDDLEKHVTTISELETSIKNAQRRNVELEEKAQVGEELEDAKETIEEMEQDLKRMKNEVEEAQEDRDEAIREKERAVNDLEELQDEMANKSITTKGLSRQIEEKANRLEDDLEDLREKHTALEEQYADKVRELKKLEDTIDTIQQNVEVREQKLKDKLELANNDKSNLAREKESLTKRLESVQKDLKLKTDEKDTLATRLNSAHRELQQKTHESETLSTRLASARQELQQQVDEADTMSTRLASAQRELQQAINENESMSTRLASAQREIQQKASENEVVFTRLDSAQRELQQKTGETEMISTRLEAAQRELQQRVTGTDSTSKRLEALQRELQQKSDEKSLLQIRHDALTTESAGLQRDLANARNTIEDLEDKLDHEKTLALNNEREVRDQYKAEIDRLHDEVENLRAQIREKERQLDNETDKWEGDRRNLEAQKSLADEKAAGLQRTIERLQEAEGSLSSKEQKLQQALESERLRHDGEEAVLKRQITELNEDILARRKSIDEVRSELTNVREELRLSQRERKILAEKAEGLEDEIEILQTSLDDESEEASKELSAAKQEVESFRRQLQAAKQDLARAEIATANAQALVATFQGDIQDGEGSKEQLSSRLMDVESQLSRVRKEKQDLQNQLSKINVEVRTLRTSRADVEAERDELISQMMGRKEQEEETFQDQERMNLRASKLKLDGEVRRLREENKLVTSEKQTLENELQQEIDRAGAEEARLNTEIHDLQRILRGSSEKRELAAAKKTVNQLEDRVRELESQLASGEAQMDATVELSMIRRDLDKARRKETEYQQRESSQKEIVRDLKRQITELERKAHEATISRFASSSPPSSSDGSVLKSEVVEVRAQLATAHQTLKDVRSQLREVEREAKRKVNAVNLEMEKQLASWETEKDEYERSLDEAQYAKEELQVKNQTAEATVSRLRSKIDRLEKALAAERANVGDDRTMAAERRDLHDMLRTTQVQVETLELVVQERDKSIATISTAEAQLRFQLKRVRDERSSWREKSTTEHEQLERLKQRYQKAKADWEAEKKHLTSGVRFANTSISYTDDKIEEMKQNYEKQIYQHVIEARGLNMLCDWLEAKTQKLERYRKNAAYVKTYLNLRIDLYEACNKADLELLRKGPLYIPSRIRPPPKITIRKVVIMVKFIRRCRIDAEDWSKAAAIEKAILAQQEKQRLAAMGGPNGPIGRYNAKAKKEEERQRRLVEQGGKQEIADDCGRITEIIDDEEADEGVSQMVERRASTNAKDTRRKEKKERIERRKSSQHRRQPEPELYDLTNQSFMSQSQLSILSDRDNTRNSTRDNTRENTRENTRRSGGSLSQKDFTDLSGGSFSRSMSLTQGTRRSLGAGPSAGAGTSRQLSVVLERSVEDSKNDDTKNESEKQNGDVDLDTTELLGVGWRKSLGPATGEAPKSERKERKRSSGVGINAGGGVEGRERERGQMGEVSRRVTVTAGVQVVESRRKSVGRSVSAAVAAPVTERDERMRDRLERRRSGGEGVGKK